MCICKLDDFTRSTYFDHLPFGCSFQIRLCVIDERAPAVTVVSPVIAVFLCDTYTSHNMMASANMLRSKVSCSSSVQMVLGCIVDCDVFMIE